MLDVHAPHGKLEGVKDFLLHLFTITVGLLIALGLEGCVERYHNNELRHEAETNLRQEVLDNRQKLADARPVMEREEKTLKIVMDFIAAKKAGKPYKLPDIDLGFSIRPLSDASWRTASATGALALMSYNEVQGYTGIYHVQEELMLQEHDTLNDYLQVQAYTVYGFDPDKVTATEAAVAEADVRRALAHLVAMEQIGASMTAIYDKALQQQQRK
jgi:hypothetical protein